MRNVATWLALCALVALLQEISCTSPEDEVEQGRLDLQPRKLSKRYYYHQSTDPYYVAVRNACGYKQRPYYQRQPLYGRLVRINPGYRRGNIHISPCLCPCSKQHVHGSSEVNIDNLIKKYKANCNADQSTNQNETGSYPSKNEQTLEGSSKNDLLNFGDSSDHTGDSFTYNTGTGVRTGYEYESSHGYPLSEGSLDSTSGLYSNTDQTLSNEQYGSSADHGSLTTQGQDFRNQDNFQNTPVESTIPKRPDLSDGEHSSSSQYSRPNFDTSYSVEGSTVGRSSDVSKLGLSTNIQQKLYPVGGKGFKNINYSHGSLNSNTNHDNSGNSKYGYPTVSSQEFTDYMSTTSTDRGATQHVDTQKTGKPESSGTNPSSGIPREFHSKTNLWPDNENLRLEMGTGVSGNGFSSERTSGKRKFDIKYGYPTIEGIDPLLPTSHGSISHNQQSQGLTTHNYFSKIPPSRINKLDIQYGYPTLLNQGTIPTTDEEVSFNLNHTEKNNRIPQVTETDETSDSAVHIENQLNKPFGYPTGLSDQSIMPKGSSTFYRDGEVSGVNNREGITATVNPGAYQQPGSLSTGDQLNYGSTFNGLIPQTATTILSNRYYPTMNNQIPNTSVGSSQFTGSVQSGQTVVDSTTGGVVFNPNGQGSTATLTQEANKPTGSLSTGDQLNYSSTFNGLIPQPAGTPLSNRYYSTMNSEIPNTAVGSTQFTGSAPSDQTDVDSTNGGVVFNPNGQGSTATLTQGANQPTGSLSTGDQLNYGSTFNGLIPQTARTPLSNRYYSTMNSQIPNTAVGSTQLTGSVPSGQTVVDSTTGRVVFNPNGQGSTATLTQGANQPTGSLSTVDQPNYGSTFNGLIPQTAGTPLSNRYYSTMNSQIPNTAVGSTQFTGSAPSDQTDVDSTNGGVVFNPNGQGSTATLTQGANQPTGSLSTTDQPNYGSTFNGLISQIAGTPLSNRYYSTMNSQIPNTSVDNTLNSPSRSIYGYNYDTNSRLLTNSQVALPYDKLFSQEGGNHLTKYVYDQQPQDSTNPIYMFENGNGMLENQGTDQLSSSTTSLHDSNNESELTSEGISLSEQSQLKDTSTTKLPNTQGNAQKQQSTSSNGVTTDLLSDQNDKVVSLNGYSMKQSQLQDIINSFKTPEKCVLTVPQVFSGSLDRYAHVMNSYPATVGANEGFVHMPSDLIVPFHCYKYIASVYSPNHPLFADVPGTVLPSGHFVESSTVGNILASVKTPKEVMILTPQGLAVPYNVYSKYIDGLSPKDKKLLKVVIPNEKIPITFDVYEGILNKYVTKPSVNQESGRDIIKLLGLNAEMTLDQFLAIFNSRNSIKEATVTLPSQQSLSLTSFLQIAKIVGEEYTKKCIVNIPNTDAKVPFTVLKDIFKTYLENKPFDLTKDTVVNLDPENVENPFASVDELEDDPNPVLKPSRENGYPSYGRHGVNHRGHYEYYHPRSRYFLTEAAEAVSHPSLCPSSRDYSVGSPEDESDRDPTEPILNVLHPGHGELLSYCPLIDEPCRSYQRRNSKSKQLYSRPTNTPCSSRGCLKHKRPNQRTPESSV